MGTIKTTNIEPIADNGTVTLGSSGDTFTVPTGVGLTATDEVKSNKLSPATGTALQIGDSGDTITIPSGATIVNSGTQTGFGGANTPAFSVRISGNISIPNNGAATKITFDTEDIDTDNTFASNKFTPGVAGKYFISLNVVIENGTNGEMEIGYISIYKNGSAISGSDARVDFRGNKGRGAGPCATVLIDLDTDDYIEGYAFQQSGTGSANIMAYGTRMQGYKIIT